MDIAKVTYQALTTYSICIVDSYITVEYTYLHFMINTMFWKACNFM